MPEPGNCHMCGHPEKPSVGEDCPSCGTVNYGVLRLIGSSGAAEEFRTPARVGARLLASVDSDGARFASECQFELDKDESFCSWSISIRKEPTHRTFVNGAPLVVNNPIKLTHGDSISIEDRVLKLRVEFV